MYRPSVDSSYWGEGGSNKQSKQTNSLSDASATGDSRQTVEKSEEKKNSPSSFPLSKHFYQIRQQPLWKKFCTGRAAAHGMELVWNCHKHTLTRVLCPVKRRAGTPSALAIPFRRRPSSLQAHSLQKLLIRRSSHVIQILTYSDFASLYPLLPPFSCPSLRASLHRVRPVLVVEISDPIHIRKLKANVKTHKVAN